MLRGGAFFHGHSVVLLFYGYYTQQPALASSTSSDFVGGKFHCPHAFDETATTSAFGFARKCKNSSQRFYLHCLHAVSYTPKYSLYKLLP